MTAANTFLALKTGIPSPSIVLGVIGKQNSRLNAIASWIRGSDT